MSDFSDNPHIPKGQEGKIAKQQLDQAKKPAPDSPLRIEPGHPRHEALLNHWISDGMPRNMSHAGSSFMVIRDNDQIVFIARTDPGSVNMYQGSSFSGSD